MNLPTTPMGREELRRLMRTPEGTVRLGGTYPGIHEDHENRVLFQIVTGAHVFRIVQRGRSCLLAAHGTPGSGTAAAELDIAALSPHESLVLWLAWTPELVRLMAADPDAMESIIQAEGTDSPTQLLCNDDGAVVETEGELRGMRIMSQGKAVMSPPAIALWNDVVEATGTLLTGESKSGFQFEVVLSNAALGMTVTGFETYCQERFYEIEGEGVEPDAIALLRRFGSTEEREMVARGDTPAVAKSKPLARALGQRLNFQSYEDCKHAYSKGYGIKFGEDLGVTSQLLERVQRLIQYRHRIVHVSPSIGLLNQKYVPPEEPEVASRHLAQDSVTTFNELIQALHRVTLRLRPVPATS